jgi:pantothenate kinase
MKMPITWKLLNVGTRQSCASVCERDDAEGCGGGGDVPWGIKSLITCRLDCVEARRLVGGKGDEARVEL